MAFASSTLRETITRLMPEGGIRDYLTRFYLLHTDNAWEGDADEEAMIRRLSGGTDAPDEDLERQWKRSNRLLRESIALLAGIESAEGKSGEAAGVPVQLKAMHLALFAALYQIGSNLRNMVESLLGGDDLEESIERLIATYDMDEVEADALTMGWVDQAESICQGLLDQEFDLMLFHGCDGTCFLLRNRDGVSALKVPAFLTRDNGIIHSRHYFLLQIVMVLRNIELLTRISSLEKDQPYMDEDIEVMEVFEMESVRELAETFMDRQA